MPTFSERMGIIKPRDVIQSESIDQPLMNRLWDIVRGGYLATATVRLENHHLGGNYDRISTS